MISFMCGMIIWVLGVCICLAIINHIGRTNPDTNYDSFSGDVGLDLTLCLFWFIFLPCFAVYKITQFIMEIFS